MIKKIQDFYCLDYLCEEEVQEVMIYASTHD